MLTLEGKAAEVTRDFQKVIETMPAKFQMKMTDDEHMCFSVVGS
jgi:hypothetical protein